MHFNWRSVDQLRLRLLLCTRFFMLRRKIDLERLFRKVSFVGDNPFVLMKSKGFLRPQCEAMVKIPDVPTLCPWTLLKTYVALTSKQVSAGSRVFISLKGPPFVPLKANSIGSITKQSLQKLGVDTTVWKAHSTRGAGVAMYKSLGFTSEEVCELGKWKNVSAFLYKPLFAIECH